MLSQLIHIDSRNRDNYANTSEASFAITFKLPINVKRRLRVVDLVFPNGVYNVNANNNSLRYTDSGAVAHTVTVAAGNYTAATFEAALKTALDASTGLHVFTVAHNTQTYKVTISATGSNFSIQFTSALTTMARLLGFAITDVSGATTYTGTKALNISEPNLIYFKTSPNFKDSYNTTIRDSVLFKLPVDVSFSNIVFYSPPLNDSSWFNWEGSFNKLIFKLTNQDDQQIDNNGYDWNLTLQME